ARAERPPIGRDTETEHPGRHHPAPPELRVIDVAIGERRLRKDVRVDALIRHPEPAVLRGVDPLSRWSGAGLWSHRQRYRRPSGWLDRLRRGRRGEPGRRRWRRDR